MNPRQRIVTALPTLLVASTFALTVAPAAAETHVTRDAHQDVVTGAATNDTFTTPVPDRHEADLISMRVKHGGRHINVTMKYAELSRVPGATTVHAISLKSDTSARVDLDVLVVNDQWKGEQVWHQNGSDRRCVAVRTKIDYRENTVRAAIPNKCLGNPEWVRVGGAAASLADDTTYADDVSRDGAVEDDLAFGPKIRIG